ncbi:hypothetical protein GCM10007394_00650 [Salinibacterium amurskyense]|nr:hypothetical protein GCM10007394_00650 [Salinibacterium amurskyense]
MNYAAAPPLGEARDLSEHIGDSCCDHYGAGRQHAAVLQRDAHAITHIIQAIDRAGNDLDAVYPELGFACVAQLLRRGSLVPQHPMHMSSETITGLPRIHDKRAAACATE